VIYQSIESLNREFSCNSGLGKETDEMNCDQKPASDCHEDTGLGCYRL